MPSLPDQPYNLDGFARLAREYAPAGRLLPWSLRHEVLPLLARLASERPEAVPGVDLEALRDMHLRNAQRTLRLVRTLLQLLELLRGSGVEALLLKGPAWALQAYGDLALRFFDDLDLLIHAADFPAAYAALCAAGWQPEIDLQPKEFRWLTSADNDLAFTRQEARLELHWDVAERGNAHPISPDFWWQDTETVELLGRPVRVPSAENTFLLMCLHGTKHQWQLFKYIIDLDGFLNHSPGLDLNGATALAQRYGLRRAAGLGLFLAEKYTALALPAGVREAYCHDPVVATLAAEVAACLESDALRVDDGWATRFTLRSRERLRHRAYYILDQAFRPKQVDWRAISLPAGLYPAYYLLRPLRLVNKFILRRTPASF